jgi:3-carboxy-cis,cis-muconate cycloisomerase
MSDLFWPGDDRAGDLLSSGALLDAMVAVEAAWLAALVAAGVAPEQAADDLAEALGAGAEAGGNPVIGLVALLRERAGTRSPEAARWLHRGLTSQDVLDTALVLILREATEVVRAELATQARCLVDLAATHRATPMVARTLTQHAVPTTFGLKAATWLTGVLDADDDLAALAWPAQVGGAAGTLAAVVELAGGQASGDAAQVALDLSADAAARLGLLAAAPWHTSRAALTRVADALVRATDAWGRVANDVLVLSRPEIGELAEGTGGGSSTMPHKANPVLSTLVRRAALSTPQLAATMHLAAAEQVDERADGGWHVEAATLRTLGRRTVVAARQATELLGGLRVHPDRMRATLEVAHDDVHTEQSSLAPLTGRTGDAAYLGASDRLIEGVLHRARALVEENL